MKFYVVCLLTYTDQEKSEHFLKHLTLEQFLIHVFKETKDEKKYSAIYFNLYPAEIEFE